MDKIEIPLKEYDVNVLLPEMLQNNSTIKWVYQDQNGKDITIELMTEDEFKQRGN